MKGRPVSPGDFTHCLIETQGDRDSLGGRRELEFAEQDLPPAIAEAVRKPCTEKKLGEQTAEENVAQMRFVNHNVYPILYH